MQAQTVSSIKYWTTLSFERIFVNFQGNTEQHQLTLIAQLCGALTPEVWPGVETLDLYNKIELPKSAKRR